MNSMSTLKHLGVAVIFTVFAGNIVAQQSQSINFHDLQIEGNAISLEWSPDGQFLAVSVDAEIQIFDLSYNLVATLKGHTDPIHEISWKPDGTQLASASANTVQIWDMSLPIQDRSDPLNVIDFGKDVRWVDWSPNPDHNRIAVSVLEGTRRASDWFMDILSIQVVDPDSGQNVFTIPAQLDLGQPLAWYPNGMYIASTVLRLDGYPGLQIWDMNGTLVFDQAMVAPINSIAWSTNGDYLVVGDSIKKIICYRL